MKKRNVDLKKKLFLGRETITSLNSPELVLGGALGGNAISKTSCNDHCPTLHFTFCGTCPPNSCTDPCDIKD